MKLSGGCAQINCVVGAALLTLVIRSSNNVPDPESGVRSSEKADMRNVLIGHPVRQTPTAAAATIIPPRRVEIPRLPK